MQAQLGNMQTPLATFKVTPPHVEEKNKFGKGLTAAKI